MDLVIHTDGGSRGNPGPSAIGIVVEDDHKTLFESSLFIGVGTNNEAEYKALILALGWLIENQPGIEKACFYLDSLLVVSQMQGKYQVKVDRIRTLHAKAHEIIAKLPFSIEFRYIPREKNKRADQLVNLALDKQV